MGLFDGWKAISEAKRVQAQAAIAEANARIAEARTTVARQQFAQRIYETPSVDPIEEREGRYAAWQTDHLISVKKCRRLYESDPLASTIVGKIVDNVVGSTGADLEVITGNTELNTLIENEWYKWLNHCEVSGLRWDEFCRLSLTHKLVDGDVACALLNDAGDQLTGYGRIQLICADQITGGSSDEGSKGNGIITDATGYVVAFNVEAGSGYVQYPSSAVIFSARRKALRDSQGKRVWRGTSIFASNYELFQKATKWRNAEVNAAIAAAKIVFVLTKANPQQWGNALPTNAQGDRELDLSGDSAVATLEQGEDIKQFQGTHPTNNYSEPFRLLLRELGAETGLPLEILICDWSQANFASTRTALIFTRRAFRQMQSELSASIFQPIYRWFVQRLIDAGKLDQFKADPAFANAFNARFVLPSWPAIDPLREAMYEQLMRDMGYRTFTDYCLENGIDPIEQVKRLQSDIKLFQDHNLPQYHSNSSMPLEQLAKLDAMDATDQQDPALVSAEESINGRSTSNID